MAPCWAPRTESGKPLSLPQLLVADTGLGRPRSPPFGLGAPPPELPVEMGRVPEAGRGFCHDPEESPQRLSLVGIVRPERGPSRTR